MADAWRLVVVESVGPISLLQRFRIQHGSILDPCIYIYIYVVYDDGLTC